MNSKFYDYAEALRTYQENHRKLDWIVFPAFILAMTACLALLTWVHVGL